MNVKVQFLKTQKAQSIKEKLINWTSLKFKTSAFWKVILRKRKDTLHSGRKDSHIFIYDKRLMSRIYKEVL